ncbi:hypothetical protein E2C01_100805 [Portunus trituberculatus]|uniref:Uncharacterized protein n=1 Tax=Portunus trituberculatus TaxID=210409 RepID=A0A5B7KD50_PORTR|nr:hypothetical protein [Portunus trituberculatus]
MTHHHAPVTIARTRTRTHAQSTANTLHARPLFHLTLVPWQHCYLRQRVGLSLLRPSSRTAVSRVRRGAVRGDAGYGQPHSTSLQTLVRVNSAGNFPKRTLIKGETEVHKIEGHWWYSLDLSSPFPPFPPLFMRLPLRRVNISLLFSSFFSPFLCVTSQC